MEGNVLPLTKNEYITHEHCMGDGFQYGYPHVIYREEHTGGYTIYDADTLERLSDNSKVIQARYDKYRAEIWLYEDGEVYEISSR